MKAIQLILPTKQIRGPRKWNTKLNQQLTKFYNSGMPIGQIASCMSVTKPAVESRIKRLHALGILESKRRYGKRQVTSHGYVKLTVTMLPISQAVLAREMTTNQSIFEHRLVMALFLGRPLKKTEIVHHLNGVRSDNQIENLCLTTYHEHPHYTLIKKSQDRIRFLEIKLYQALGQEKKKF
jgi:DNA-binding Lrp family transcriptional regulator